jgi:hypothetical protein
MIYGATFGSGSGHSWSQIKKKYISEKNETTKLKYHYVLIWQK